MTKTRIRTILFSLIAFFIIFSLSCKKPEACIVVQDCCNYINNSPAHKKIAGKRCEYAKFGIDNNNEKACLNSYARIRGEIGNAYAKGVAISPPDACKLK